ncbi:LysE family translocator [Granulosicoccus antarcticus]|nr:LysE family translocator [Granulosicoccus antarcticus]
MTWLMFALAMLVLTASPGPSVLLGISKAITIGMEAALYAVIGSTCAIVCIITLSFSGLGLILASSELAFSTVKWCGAAYLIYLGLRALMTKTIDSDGRTDTAAPSTDSPSRWSHWLSGFLVGASNPKSIVFFTALFPQFIDTNGHMFTQYCLFVITFVVIEMSLLMLYASFGHRTSQWWQQPGRLQWFNKATGGLFIGAGVLLAASAR